MISSYISNDCVIVGNKIMINGTQVPPVPGKRGNYRSVTTINNKVYIDGYEFVGGYWKKTLRALWYKWF